MNKPQEEKPMTVRNVIQIISSIISTTFALFLLCGFLTFDSYATWGFGILLGVELFTSLIGALVIGFRISKN